jgi:integrase/recombinase XerD
MMVVLIISGIRTQREAGAMVMQLNDPTARAFVESLRPRSEHTARSYAQAVGRFLEETNKPVDQLTVADAANYLGSLSGLSAASRAHHISAVRSFLKYCQGQGIIPQTPLDTLRRPRVALTSMTRYLVQEEVEKLLKAAQEVSPQCYAACATLMLTGLRVSELASAQWRHLFPDPEGRLGLMVVGKGGKERVVKVRDDLFGLLCEERSRKRLPTKLDGRDRSPLLAGRGKKPYTTRGLHKLVATAAKAASIDKPVSPHWLRHSFATLAAVGGAAAYQLQADLGHARLETSQRYVHWAKGLAESAVDALPIGVLSRQ